MVRFRSLTPSLPSRPLSAWLNAEALTPISMAARLKLRCLRCVGDGYDNAVAEAINGLYTAELTHGREPRRSEPVCWIAMPLSLKSRGR